MKKILYVMMLTLSFLLTACNRSSAITYNSFICDYTNDGVISSVEKDWWTGGSKSRQEASDKKETTFQESRFLGSYQDSFLASATHFAMDRYIDNEKNATLYYQSSTGQFCGIHFYNLINDEYYSRKDIVDEKQALEMAKEVLSQYINIDEYRLKTEHYTLPNDIPNDNQQDDSDIIMYAFSFVKEIDGFSTSDEATYVITSKGDLFSIRLSDIGLFSEKTLPEIDKTKLTESVEKKLNEIYAKKFSYTYNIVDQTLTISPDGCVVVASQIELALDDLYNTGIILATEIESK